MNKKLGIILKVSMNKIFVVFAFSTFVKKYGKLQHRMIIKQIKVRSKEFKKGDFILCNDNYTKISF